MSCSGTLLSLNPASTTTHGIPYTTQLLSASVKTSPPFALIQAAPCFPSDHVDDSMVGRTQVMKFDSVLLAVFTESFHLHSGKLVLDRLILVDSRNVMIRSSNGSVRVFDSNTALFQIKESYRGSHFMDKMLIDEEYIWSCWHGFDHVRIPDFIK